MTEKGIDSLSQIGVNISSVEDYRKYIIDEFHKLYYDSNFAGGTWKNTFWLGVPTLKNPLDLWIYQELIYELKPDKIIECGTAHGGSALFMATMCDLINNGEVITVDIRDYESRPQHNRIKYLLGSSVSTEIVGQIENSIGSRDTVMVVLDSDHSKKHVLNELRTYSNLVSKESYMIVEDTNINGHPVWPENGPGPMEAVEEFLGENNNFVVDNNREKFYLTFNPKGFLRKMK
ncbi:MAG: CmcI family methyltransferase [Nitrososphaerales archaeon]